MTHKYIESSEKRNLPAGFLVKFVMLPVANRADKLICLHACPHKCDRAGPIDKSENTLTIPLILKNN